MRTPSARPPVVLRKLAALGAIALSAALPSIGMAQSHTPVTDQMLLDAAKEPNNWLMAGRDYAGTRFSPLATVNAEAT